MKNRRLAILLLALLPILAGCVRLEGDITIDTEGLATGKISYALDKSLASQAGINSVDDFKKNAVQQNDNQVCSSESYTESAQELIFECNFSRSTLKDSDLRVEKIGDQVTFYFKQTSSGDTSVDLGKTSLSVTFPGPITAIKESKTGAVIKKSENSALISASGTATLDIAITSSVVPSKIGTATPAGKKSYDEMLADWNAREMRQKEIASKINKNIKIGMKINPKLCRMSWTRAPSSMKVVFTQYSKAPQIAEKYYQEFVTTSDLWLRSATECANVIDVELAKQGKTNASTPATLNPELAATFSSFSAQGQILAAELTSMVQSCKVMEKYAQGIESPAKPNFTGDPAQDAALVAQYQSAMKAFEAKVNKIRPIYKGNQCASAKTALAISNEDDEEVLEGEEVANYEIVGKVISVSSTRINLVASPNTVVTVTASKKGVKKKLSFKVKTDANGEKVFRTSSNLKGYVLTLFESGDQVASTMIN
jgi:hypothetical protein